MLSESFRLIIQKLAFKTQRNSQAESLLLEKKHKHSLMGCREHGGVCIEEQACGSINQNENYHLTRLVSTQLCRKVAFTLAEVLITLGIIGVVAALTLPTLIQNYKEKQTVSQLKKVYSILSQSFMRAVEQDGTPEGWSITSNSLDAVNHEALANKFIPYLKVQQNCIGMSKEEAYAKCFLSDTLSEPQRAATIILSDGTSIAFRMQNSKCDSNYGEGKNLSNICGQIAVDINGLAKPNSAGIDKFNFYYTKYGLVPFGLPQDLKVTFDETCNHEVEFNKVLENTYRNGDGCTAWVIHNENMDYLHCSGLSWDGKSKCK